MNNDKLFLQNDWLNNALLRKTRGLELVIYMLPNMFKNHIYLLVYPQAILLVYPQAIFGTLIDRGFWIPKITVRNLCKQFDYIICSFLPTSIKTLREKKESYKNSNISNITIF